MSWAEIVQQEREFYKDLDAAIAHMAIQLVTEYGVRPHAGAGVPLAYILDRLRVDMHQAAGYPLPTVRDVKRVRVSTEVALAVHQRCGWRCQCCGSYEDLTVDHIRATINGGSNGYENLQTLCNVCNASKHEGITCSIHGRVIGKGRND